MMFDLGLMITERCNIKCRHCIFGNGEFMHSGKDMRTEDMKSYVDQMAALAAKGKMDFSLSFSGGEPFLCFPQLLEMCRYARSAGAVKISTMTNGFWGSDEKKAEQTVQALTDAGLDLICVSMDDFHQEHVPLSSVLTVLKLCREHHLAFSIKCVVTKKSHRLGDVINSMGNLMMDHQIAVQEIPCCPEGRAALTIPKEDLFYKEGIPSEICTVGSMVIILPDGSVYPCCGTGWNSYLCMGNAQTDTLEKIYSKIKNDPVIHILYQNGPAYFLRFFEQAAQPIQKEGYISSCGLCHAMLTHPAFPEILSAAAKCWRQERTKKIMAGLLKQENVPVS